MNAGHRKLGLGLIGVLALAALTAGTPRADTYRADVELTNKEIGVKQAGLGDLVADAIRASAHVDAAFVPASAFSESAITVTRAGFGLPDVLKALEYKGDTIAIVKLTGEQIRGALENSLYQLPGRNVAFLQVSGLVVNYNAGATAGKRITSVSVGGSALQPGKTYRIAMPLPLANGGNAYFKYWKKADIEKDTGVSLESALGSYLNEHKTIAKGEDRLVASSK